MKWLDSKKISIALAFWPITSKLPIKDIWNSFLHSTTKKLAEKIGDSERIKK